MTHAEETTPHRKWWTLTRRRWAYGVLVAAGTVLVVHGIVTTEQVAAWLLLGAALLGVTGLAVANPTPEPGNDARADE